MDILLEQGWSEIDSTLVKNFRLSNFTEAMKFANQIAQLAQEMDHHPDINIYSYKNVKITLTTHSQGRITSKDILLAKQIDSLFTS